MGLLAESLPPKLEAYWGILQKYVIEALESDGVKKSCVASLLLVFAAMDGLGRLIHNKENASNNERLTAFLNLMGSSYIAKASQLCELRHTLAHSSLNVGAAMSHLPDSEHLHLRQLDPSLPVVVNTAAFVKDFMKGLECLRSKILKDVELRNRAEGRLKWLEVKYQPDWLVQSAAVHVFYVLW